MRRARCVDKAHGGFGKRSGETGRSKGRYRAPDRLYRQRAVAMYRAAEPKPVIRQMARQLGVHPEALRNWIRQDQADAGERPAMLTTAEREELVALRREVAELRRANEILKVASAFFAQELDPIRRRFSSSSTSTRTPSGSSPSCGPSARR